MKNNSIDPAPYAVFLDIDGTLYHHGEVPEGNISAIRDARAKGHYVFLNTARSFAAIPQKLLEIVPLDGMVAGIGTDLRLGDRQIMLHVLSTAQLKDITGFFMRCAGDRELVYEGVDYNLTLFSEPRRENTRSITSPDDFDTVYKNARICKMFVSRGMTDAETEYFEGEYTVFRHESYAEFVPKQFSKSAGMRLMLEAIGVPTERCICMGDSSNDEDMLRAAGISVAMGNAIPEIKEMCDIITDDAQNAGVGKAIRRLLGV